jgi:hypothetical protein
LGSFDGVAWIRDGEPTWIGVYHDGKTSIFRRRLSIDKVPASALLKVWAVEQAAIFIDGQQVGFINRKRQQPTLFDLQPWMSLGEHELKLVVSNTAGPSVVAASIYSLGIATDATWDSSIDNDQWRPAVSVEAPTPPPQWLAFPTAYRALLDQLWIGPVIVIVIGLGALMERRGRLGRPSAFAAIRSGILRWLVISVWTALAVNNFNKLPRVFGMDLAGHLDYAQFILDRGSLPLATDGLDMFQAPLYFLLAAGQQSALDGWYPTETVVRSIRVISILCGLGLIEASYRAARCVFPDDHRLQIVATVIAGLLPMNLYLCQAVGNEPLAAVLSSFTVVTALGIARDPSRSGSLRILLALGALWGFALLSKVSALLLAVPLATVLGGSLLRTIGLRRTLRCAAIVLVTAISLSGWYYLRNWITLGVPFMFGWDPGRLSVEWWQEPGYRTWGQFTRFGVALSHPFFAGINGFWDGLYSTLWTDAWLGSGTLPPWNFGPLVGSIWLALVPTALILVGCIQSLWRPDLAMRRDRLFAVFSVFTFLAALLVVYMRVPMYSVAKATYAAGLTPCIGILAAVGFACLPKYWLIQSFAVALIICWAMAVYAGFFALFV